MEGISTARVAPMNSSHGVNNPLMNNDADMSSLDSDSSSGDSKLERKLMTSTPLRSRRRRAEVSSDPREDVPLEQSPPPRRSSKSSRQRPYEQDRSPLSWYYSQREYSPSVSSVTTPRKSLTSWVDAILNTPTTEPKLLEENDDDVSLDSVEELEQAAMRIRSEIRQLEMKELADEAESAAEAGHERFAGRACTFGDSTHSLDYIETIPKPHLRLRRFSTYSEGTSILKQAALRPVIRSKPKIRCLQLRDINEVIPRMDELHLHLKTHFLMAGVDRACLEVPASVPETGSDDDDKRAKAVKTPVEFLSSLKSWVSTTPSRSSAPQSPSTDVASNITTPRRSTVGPCKQSPAQTQREDECECSVASQDSYEVGGRLSGHLHEPKAVQRSPIRIPKGLDLSDHGGLPQDVMPTKILVTDFDVADVDTVDTVPTSSSSQQGNNEMEHLMPIALFEHLEEDTDSTSKGGGSSGDGSSRNSLLAASPTASVGERLSDVAAAANMFVTPMRLRGIRKASRGQVALERRSLRHNSADLGWTLKKGVQRRATSESHIPKESLDIPLLSVKSDGDCSPIARLNRSMNRSKDSSAMSLPEDVRPDEISFSMSDPIFSTNDCDREGLRSQVFRELSHFDQNSRSFVASQREETLQEESFRENVIPTLDRPKSLSFDEHDIVGDLLAKLSVEDDDEVPSMDVNLTRDVEGMSHQSHRIENVEDENAMQRKSSLELSLAVVPNDETETITAWLGKDQTAAADGDAINGSGSEPAAACRDRSATPLSIHSLSVDEDLPLMPTLENVANRKHADESNAANDERIMDEEFPEPTAHAMRPKIEQRPLCVESEPIPEIERNNDSFHSLVMDDLFAVESTNIVNDDAGKEARTSACNGKVMEIAAGAEKEQSCLESNEPASISDCDAVGQPKDYASRQQKASVDTDPVSEFYARELDTDPISEFYACELSVDENAVSDEKADVKIQSEKTYGTGISSEEVPIPVTDEFPPETAAEQLSIEVNELSDSLSDIPHHLQPVHGSCSPQSRFQKREEIVKSPSGRVRVIIEHSLHEESDTDDDDVRSEATSVHTPHPDPCECLINCATQFEESVNVDLAKASACARLRYDFPSAHQTDEVASNDKDPVEAATPAPAYIPPEEMVSLSSIPDSGGQNKWSPIRRTLSCPSFVRDIPEEKNEAMSTSFTIPHKSAVSGATSPVSAISDMALVSERRRRKHFRASSMLDPCQSTSPFKETMDDMMKSFSSKRSIEEEMKIIAQAQENHEFLNNFLYCSKPPDKQEANGGSHGIMCGEHCDYFSGVLDAYRSFVPTRSVSKKDMLSLNAVDTSLPPSAATETWFDVASEHFDGALEALMGRAHEESRRWNSMFQAPGLKFRKHKTNTSSSQDRDVKGIVLVKQTNTMDSLESDMSEHQFELLYGMKREEFAQLPVMERSVLHDVAYEKRRRWASRRSKTKVDFEPPSPSVSIRSLSSSDLPKMAEL